MLSIFVTLSPISTLVRLPHSKKVSTPMVVTLSPISTLVRISQLKKAGFTMAFAGYYANGKLKAAPGIDKYQIPRYVISNTTTVNQIKYMIG